MQIYFGSNEYILAPNNYLIKYVNNTAEIHILADNLIFQDLEQVLLNPSNIHNIKIMNEDSIEYINDYHKLISLSKVYDDVIEQDIFSIMLKKKTEMDLINENTANIEFIAIMNDIDLEGA